MALETFLEVCLPYCLKRMPNGKYIILNREGLPIGFNKPKNFKFEEHLCTEFHPMSEEIALRISSPTSDDIEYIYLYKDDDSPLRSKKAMKNYLERLKYLAHLRTPKGMFIPRWDKQIEF